MTFHRINICFADLLLRESLTPTDRFIAFELLARWARKRGIIGKKEKGEEQVGRP